MGVQDPGRPFSLVADLPHDGASGETEIVLINNADADLHPAVYFVDMQIQTVDAANALDYIKLEWKDSAPTYELLFEKDANFTAGCRHPSPDPGMDLVVRYDASLAAEGRIVVEGALL